jgi:uncharacterized protein
VDHRTHASPGRLLRMLRFAPVRMGLLYVLLTYLYLAGFFFRGAMTHGPVPSLTASLLNAALMLAAFAGVVYFVERRPVSDLALRGSARELAFGVLLGFGLYAVCVLILVMLGYCRIDGLGTWHALVPGLAVTIATGVYEELWFRGTVFRLIQEWFGSWAALVISAFAFGFVHLSTEGATVRDVTFISIEAGVLLTAAYLLTGRLWLSIGFHATWNFTQGYVFSGSLSGNPAPDGLIKATMNGPELLTGGSFGMEGSVVALLVLTTVGVIMLVKTVQRGHIVPPPWMRKG